MPTSSSTLQIFTDRLPRQFDYPQQVPYSNEEKLTKGPCHLQYKKLSLCAKIKGEVKDKHHQGLCRNEMKSCPDEAKLVVNCIAENKGYFFNM